MNMHYQAATSGTLRRVEGNAVGVSSSTKARRGDGGFDFAKNEGVAFIG